MKYYSLKYVGQLPLHFHIWPWGYVEGMETPTYSPVVSRGNDVGKNGMIIV
jgi:hypothetical protein